MARILAFIAIETVLLVTPMIFPTISFELGMFIYGIAVALALGAVIFWWNERERSMKRYTLLEVRDYCTRKGWVLGGPTSLDVIDLADAVRQSAIFGEIALWGRRDRYGSGSMGLTKNEPRTKVPTEHFVDYWIEPTGLIRATDNTEIQTYQPGSSNWSQGSYCDLQMETPDLKLWERNARSDFKGRREQEHQREEAKRKAEEAEVSDASHQR